MAEEKSTQEKEASKTGLLAKIRAYFADEEFAELLDENDLTERDKSILKKYKDSS